MIVNIDGWFGGGKSVIWALLDDHSKIFVDPVHNYSFVPFLTDSFHSEWMSSKNTSKLRILLSRSEYYKYEKMMYDGVLPVHFKADHTFNLDYKIDFYKLDQNYFSTLMNLPNWSYDSILGTLYDNVETEWSGSSCHKPIKVTMGKADAYLDYWNIPERFSNMKTIFVKRDIYNIIATRSNRVARPNDLSQDKVFNCDFRVLVNNGEVEKICHCFETYNHLENQFPDKFLVINFEDLITETRETMKRVCVFLDIDFEEVLLKPTRDGDILEDKGISFISSEHDNAYELLTYKERNLVKRHINQFRFHRRPMNIMSVKSLLLYINSVVRKCVKNIIKV
ncbi:sulfotransferase [Vibrio sp. 99-8-1]|uniref:sulfotransferase n=1 Tax=Vibrio sp. 99-8-1 TaxID=2607602 RepID=UPI001493BE60|nr:sulfotransferase [Vibrio sp. 99-8-1]NOI68714.1 sulfotransferase [Vibrio sp. 99-8-1]